MMADTTHSHASLVEAPAPLTEDAFLADRQRFWAGFTSFTLFSVIALVVLLVGMALFLL
jgi:hypothetical protein